MHFNSFPSAILTERKMFSASFTDPSARFPGSKAIDESTPGACAVDPEVGTVQRGDIGGSKPLSSDEQRCIGQIRPGILAQDLSYPRHIGKSKLQYRESTPLDALHQRHPAALVQEMRNLGKHRPDRE